MDPFSLVVGGLAIAATIRKTLGYWKQLQRFPRELERLTADVAELEFVLRNCEGFLSAHTARFESSQAAQTVQLSCMLRRAASHLSETQHFLERWHPQLCVESKLLESQPVSNKSPPKRPGTQLSTEEASQPSLSGEIEVDIQSHFIDEESLRSGTTTNVSGTQQRASAHLCTGHTPVPGEAADINSQIPTQTASRGRRLSMSRPRWLKKSRMIAEMKSLSSELNNVKLQVLLMLSVMAMKQTACAEEQISGQVTAMMDLAATQQHLTRSAVEATTRQRARLERTDRRMQELILRIAVRPSAGAHPFLPSLLQDSTALTLQEPIPVDKTAMMDCDGELVGTKEPSAVDGNPDRIVGGELLIHAKSRVNRTTDVRSLGASSGLAGQTADDLSHCAWGCDCSCHHSYAMATTAHLEPILGVVFIELILPQVLSGPCNQQRCRKRSPPMAHMEYRFPAWIWMAMISANISVPSPYSLNVTLKAARIVPDDALVFRYAWEGNLEALQSLFAQNLASAHDVDATNGCAPLTYAVDRGHVEVWRFFIRMGADPYRESKAKHTVMDLACTKVYTAKVRHAQPVTGTLFNTYNTIALGEDFDLEDYVETKRFPSLHKVVLGIVDASLATLLTLSTADIDAPDYQGRTALAWAAIRGDVESVRLLLDHGADPNKLAFNLCAPLHYAVRARTPACIEILIQGGADINAQNVWSVNPLSYAAMGPDDIEYVLPLLRAKPDLNLCDKSGRSALLRAVHLNQPNIVKCLLQHGAAVLGGDIWGSGPLAVAVEKGFGAIVNILLEWRQAYSMTKTNILTLLETATRLGDAEIIRALQHVDAQFAGPAEAFCQNGS